MNQELRRGVAFGVGAYGLWGVFPLYFHLLERSGAVEIVVHRILWSLLVCVAIVTGVRGWPALRSVLRDRRRTLLLGVAAVVLAVNWGVYVYAVNSGQVVEAALGYFINPLVTVLLGVLVLHEKLRPGQWVAVGTGLVAVGVLAVAYGRVPVIALTLAASFGTYGLMKNRVGGHVGALSGLTVETLTLTPVALVALVVIEATGHGTFTNDPPWQAVLLITTGLATVAPLLLFAACASRVPLSVVGLLQYLTPVLQFLCGVLLLGERMAAARWAGFALVWVALLVLTWDSLRQARRSRAAARRPVAAEVSAA